MGVSWTAHLLLSESYFEGAPRITSTLLNAVHGVQPIATIRGISDRGYPLGTAKMSFEQSDCQLETTGD
jgi:hypothetical protein